MKKIANGIALATVSALALSGCIRETGEFKISPKETVTGSIAMKIDNDMIDFLQAIDEEIPGAADMTRGQYLRANMVEEIASLPAGVTAKPINGKRFSGVRITFDKASFAQVNRTGRLLSDEEGPKAKPLFRVAKNAKKQIVFRYNSEGFKGDEMAAAEEEVPNPRYNVSVTMPGKVLSTNGAVKKRTVTWKGNHNNVKKIRLVAISKRK